MYACLENKAGTVAFEGVATLIDRHIGDNSWQSVLLPILTEC